MAIYHFYTSDQRIQPVRISHIALVLECMCTLNCAIHKNIAQVNVHISCYTIFKSP